MTLTKNDGILPLTNHKLKVAVIGPTGNNLRRMWAGYTSSYTSISFEEMLLSSDTAAMAGVDVARKRGLRKVLRQKPSIRKLWNRLLVNVIRR